MLPSLHQRLLRAVADDIPSPRFMTRNSDKDFIHRYETHVMGVFTCTNVDCSGASWASKKVAIVIRGYPDNRCNAVIFNQRCHVCNELGSLSIDKDSYEVGRRPNGTTALSRRKGYRIREISVRDARWAAVGRLTTRRIGPQS